MTERPIYRDGYVRVGDNAECMDVAIDVQQAHLLRDTVVTELFSPLKAKVHDLSLVSDASENMYAEYSTFFGANTRPMGGVDSISEKIIFIGAHLRQFGYDGWQLTIMRNRSGRVDDSMSEQRVRTIYKVICLGGMVVQATRTVKSIKVTPAILAYGTSMNEKTLATPPHYKRVGFTTAIQPEDCENTAEFIARHTSRVKIERGL